MTRRIISSRMSIAFALAASLAACGGGGGGNGGVNSTPPPPTSATPTPPPPPPPPPPLTPPTVALLSPVQTAAPPSPVAVPGVHFDDLGDTVFPLMLTAVTENFGGDAATTEQGGTLRFSLATGWSFTLNNASLGVTSAPLNADGTWLANGTLDPPNGTTVVVVAGSADDLDYTRYGYWTLPSAVNAYYDRGGGSLLTGYITAPSDIPTSGTANYSGQMAGLYDTLSICGCLDMQQIGGDVEMAVDFGAQTLSGSMTDLHFLDREFSMIPLNNIGFTAAFDRARNLFTGTTRVTSVPGDPQFSRYYFAADASGAISGRFFGPGAREAGAVWTLSDSLHRMIGSFGVRRTGQ